MMQRIFLYIILAGLSLPFWAGSCEAAELLIDDFSNGLSRMWEVEEFSGRTHYEPGVEDGRPCLKAVSKAAASGLYLKIDLDPVDTPIISWSWKVKNVLSKGDAHNKDGDDYAARIYIVFPSFFFWRTKAINYIWANRLPQGKMIPNAYSTNAMMFAVQSGSDKTGEWQTEERNVVEDFQRAFGEKPPKIGAIAIMTDTDNTGETAEACYGAISFRNTVDSLIAPPE
jgi:hypothetical protein